MGFYDCSNYHYVLAKILPTVSKAFTQCAKKVVSDSLGLVDFSIGLVNSVQLARSASDFFFFSFYF